MGSLERRARRLEEQAELRELAEQRESERLMREVIRRLSDAELEAMRDYLHSEDREEWSEEDRPLMERLLELKEEVRREEAGEFPWRVEIEAKRLEREE